ncbi:hypothetical protein GGR54DRAFT_624576 [Hypoxylon sp. NC1633]|nr:hypothetical protein GGR54DRAFT_624576 [Hypoxylon sp. NC1633]
MTIIVPGRRRAGLSRKMKPPPLLSQINNQCTRPSKSGTIKTESSASVSAMSRGGKIREPESITAPPQSSDDGDDFGYYSDDDDDEKPRGDIKPTNFGSALSPPSSQIDRVQRRSTRDKIKPSSQGQKATERHQDDEPSSSAGSKRSAEDPLSEMGSHLADFLSSMETKKPKRRATTTYGGKSSQPKSSQSRSSQKSGPRSSAPQHAIKPSSQKPFRIYQTSPSPDPDPSSQPNGFIMPKEISPEKNRPSEESSEESKFKVYDLGESDIGAEPTSRADQRRDRSKKSRQPKLKTERDSPEPASDEFSQRPEFKLHALDDLDYLDDDDDKVFVKLEKQVSEDEAGDVAPDSPAAAAARCPMCHEVVDSELLAQHSDHGRMNIRKQTAFCRLHKRQAALKSRTQKGYPTIKWKSLDARFDKHQGFLKDILEGTQQSHYSDVLKGNVESGKNRTLLKTDDSLTPGYYGPRGLRAMTEYIMRTLSSVVRKRAVEERLVSARGYTGYVQAVLVPELAVRLIMEDMDVAEEDAREILQDSIEIGELLYEEAGDVIAGISDEEEEI